MYYNIDEQNKNGYVENIIKMIFTIPSKSIITNIRKNNKL